MSKETELQAYKDMGAFLCKQISKTDSKDTEALKAYSKTVATLTPLFDDHLPFGYMRGLSIWIGSKRDAPGVFEDYDEILKDGYPEMFEVNAAKDNSKYS